MGKVAARARDRKENPGEALISLKQRGKNRREASALTQV